MNQAKKRIKSNLSKIYSGLYSSDNIDKVDNFKAINDTIFKIVLHQPYNPFLGILTMKYCSVVPKKVIESANTEFRSSPIGTGPFKFKRWEENIKLVLRKNDEYFEKDEKGVKLPYLEAVSITFLPEKQSEFLQLIKDEIDMISGIDSSFKDEILEINGDIKNKYKQSIKMLKGPFLNTEYLAFFMNSTKEEVQSPLIRKAINIGFDKNKMIRFLRNGIGKPANGGIIPIGLQGFKINQNNIYDPEKAKEYVDEYKKITNEIPNLKHTTSPEYLVFCEFIQKELEKIGLNISIEVIPGSSLREAKANGKLDFFRASWVADYPSAENYLSLFYSKNLSPNGPNYTHFKDNFFDSFFAPFLLLIVACYFAYLFAPMLVHLGSSWLPFGSLLAPFWIPFSSLLVPFGCFFQYLNSLGSLLSPYYPF